jgi:hypothetical protein
MKQDPYVVFDLKKPESYWDEFFADVFIKLLPGIAIIAGVVIAAISVMSEQTYKYLAVPFLLGGIGSLITTLFRYRGKEFPEMNISGALKKVKVSDVRPVPCTLKGKIIGRGVPGLIWSEDFVMQDETGILFLDYRQPLGIWEFLFGLLRAKQYINEEVTVKGWYRRSPIPYLELKNLTDSSGRSFRAYVYPVKLVVSVIVIAVSALVLMMHGI